MNPRLVLQLWRQRWGKAEQGYAQKIYVGGRVSAWLRKVPYSSAWNKPGVTWLVLLLCGVFLAVVSQVHFQINGQITFAGLVIAIAMYLRRLKGILVTLLLACLSLICTLQYFTWRLGQSIVDQTGGAFTWAFIVGSAEVCVALFLAIGWIIHLWPIEQEEVAVSSNENENDYPLIDLVIICSNADEQAALKQINAGAELDWPTKKIQIYVTDSQNRQAIKEFAEKLNANFNETLASNITAGTGELIALIEVKSDDSTLLPKGFLQSTTGWFVQDAGLALLSSSQHFLAHKPCRKILSKYRQSIHNRAILRRAELPIEQAATNATLRAKLRTRSALLIDAKAEQANVQSKYLRIDRADSNLITTCKQALVDLHQMLRFYGPVITLLFFVAPLANLFGGVRLLQAPFEWWVATFLPFLALLAITEARCHGNYRLGTLKEIKDLALSAYFLIPTVKSFFKTKLASPAVAFTRFHADQNTYQFIRTTGIYLLFWANSIGALLGLWALIFGGTNQIAWSIFYCVWAICNSCLLLAKKAIDHEASEVQYFAKKQGNIEGAVRMPFGRTLICETTNFPDLLLTLKTPIPIGLSKESEMQVVLYHQNKSYTIRTRILEVHSQQCTVLVSAESQTEYQALKDAVFARGANWPQWLPHQNADKPFPAWVYKAITIISSKAADLLTNLSTHPFLEIFIQLWKKQK
jgi:cellulose synthase (UDP-forming)